MLGNFSFPQLRLCKTSAELRHTGRKNLKMVEFGTGHKVDAIVLQEIKLGLDNPNLPGFYVVCNDRRRPGTKLHHGSGFSSTSEMECPTLCNNGPVPTKHICDKSVSPQPIVVKSHSLTCMSSQGQFFSHFCPF